MQPSILTLSGFLVTFFIDMVNSKIKDSDTRRIVSYLFCIMWGTAINFVEHNGFMGYQGLTLVDIVTSVLVTIGAVIGFSQVTYKATGWENSDLRSDLGLNAKTN